jgi:hypothetical protein
MHLGGQRRWRCGTITGWDRHCIKYLKNAANLTYVSIPAAHGEDGGDSGCCRGTEELGEAG